MRIHHVLHHGHQHFSYGAEMQWNSPLKSTIYPSFESFKRILKACLLLSTPSKNSQLTATNPFCLSFSLLFLSLV